MYYFVSDIHLGGLPTPGESKSSEDRFVEWLDSVAHSATAIFINGDLFDFWFEYRRVVPKGFIRTLGRLESLTRAGVRVVFMAGNHDQWVGDYLHSECGVEVYTTPHIFDIAGRSVYLAHGDNLNIKRGVMLKFMNWCFHSPFIRWVFSTLIHPDLTMKFGRWWSHSSRRGHNNRGHAGRELAAEFLIEHAEMVHAKSPCDYYIFGHLHLQKEVTMPQGGQIIFTNDWSEEPYCAKMDMGGNIKLEKV